MKVEILKSGKWGLDGVRVIDVREGETASMPFEDAHAMIDVGWARVPIAKTETPQVKVEETKEEVTFDREAVEEEYRKLGGRPRDDWSDEELMERLAERKKDQQDG